jgi:hypothetical protein
MRTITALLTGVWLLGTCHAAPENEWIERHPKADRLSAPPPGKALVNFHRQGSLKKLTYSVFNRAGTFLADVPYKGEFQCVCDPGEQVFIGWLLNSNISVIKADLEAGRVYDVLIDGNKLKMFPLTRDDPRRASLAEWEADEDPVSLKRLPRVSDSEARARPRVEQIVKDFLGGPKSERVLTLGKADRR